MSMKNYEKTVWITGGSSGFGKAMAQLFLEDGYTVVIAAHNADRLAQAAEEIGCDSFLMDVTCSADWKKAAAYAQEKYGGIDILINNAGGGVAIRYTITLTDDEIDRVIDLNLKSVIYGSRAFAPIMMEQKRGTIVNISSVCAKQAWPQWTVYASAKWGVLGFTKGLYTELQPYNIRVCCAIPAGCGATNFDRSANLPARDLLLQPQNFAKAVVETCKLPQHVVVEEITVWGIDQVVVPL